MTEANENKNVALMRGNPEKAVKKLAIPIMISMIITALYNIIDGIWVAGLGQSAIAGIGFVTPIFMILNGASVGLGNGATSAISRYVGAKDKKRADSAAEHSLLIFIIASIILTVVLLLILEPLLHTYGASGKSLAEGMKYGVPLFAGLVGFMLSNGATGILRGEGDMKRAMYATIFGVVLNAIFDPICIYTLGFGSAGAAIATVSSSLIGAALILYWILIKKDTYVEINLSKFKWNSKIAKTILEVGIPSSMDMLMMSIAVSIYLIFISTVGGEYGVAVFTSGQRLYLFGIMPLTAIGAAIVAVVGSAYGAKNGDYIERAHKYGVKFAVAVGLIITTILVVFSNQLSFIFAYTPETIHLVPGIALFLQIATLCLPFTGIGMPSSFLYQGLGKGIISLIWTIIREVIFAVIATYVLGILFNGGLIGIWIGLSLGRSIAAILNYGFAKYTIKKVRGKLGT